MTSRRIPARLLVLGALGVVLSGCAKEEITEPDVGQIDIRVGTDQISPDWTLTLPSGLTTTGQGDSTLTSMPVGGYSLAWGAVRGWDSPTPNPIFRTLDAGAVVTFFGSYSVITDPMGTVIVDPSPNDLHAAWVLSGPNGFSLGGSGDAVLRGRAAGTYDIVWAEVSGYETPAPRGGTLTADGLLQLAATYALREIPTGTVAIDADPDELAAPWSLVAEDGTTRNGLGDSTLQDIPVGDYTLHWDAIEGWNSPATNGETRSVEANALASFSGTYIHIQDPTGTVVVNADPEGLGGQWLLSGPNSFLAAGQGDQTLPGREVGNYLLRWGDVTGYLPPATASGSLEAGATLTLSGTYEPATGTLRIDPDPDSIEAAWSMTVDGGAPVSGIGDQTLQDLPVGTYTLTWWDVEGWEVPFPNPRTIELGSGDDRTVTGVYVQQAPATGNVAIDVLPGDLNAPWLLIGPDSFSRSGVGDAFLADLALGSYTITWQGLANWNTPNPAQQTKTLQSDATLSFVGVYGAADSPELNSVTGSLANGGTAVLNGAKLGLHTLDVSSGVGPNGWIEANAVGTDFESLSGAPGWDLGVASGSPVSISSERAHSGSKSTLTRVDPAADGGWQGVMRYQHSGGFRGIYASWWVYFDPTAYAPRTQWKHWRINDDGGVNNNCSNIWQSSMWTSGAPVYFQTGPECQLGCPWPSQTECMAQVVPDPYYDPLYGDPFQYMDHNRAGAEPFSVNAPTPRQWCRVELFVEASDVDASNGTFMLAITKPGQPRKLVDKWTGLQTHRSDCCRDSSLPWQWFMFQNYFDDNGGAFHGERADIFIDDIYLQFETQARVEIGNSPDYVQCTQLEVQTPTSWSSDRIEFTVNRGAFGAGQSAWLFVIREDGTPSAGFPIALQ